MFFKSATPQPNTSQDAGQPRARVMIASSDFRRASYLRGALLRKHYAVSIALEADTALQRLSGGGMDLVILDMDHPAFDGLAWIRQTRDAEIAVPILIVHASGTLETLLAAFDAGADAYIRGWYSDAELLAQMAALGRRREEPAPRAALSLLPSTV